MSTYTRREMRGDAVILLVVCVVIFCVALTIFTLSRCAADDQPAEPVADQRFGLQDSPIDSQVFMDRKTGVYYLVLEDGNGIAVTPLLNIDGLPLCVDDANHGNLESALADIRGNLTDEDEQEAGNE